MSGRSNSQKKSKNRSKHFENLTQRQKINKTSSSPRSLECVLKMNSKRTINRGRRATLHATAKNTIYKKMTSDCRMGMSTIPSISTFSSGICAIGTSLFCSMTRIVAFSTIWLNLPQYRTRRATLWNMGTLRSSQFSSFVHVLTETLISREPTWHLVAHSIHHSGALEPGAVLTPCDLW